MAIQPNQTAGGSASFGDGGVSSTAGNTGAGLGSATSDTDIGTETRARELALQARERAGEFVGQYKDRARSGVEDTMTRAANELGTVANALRQCASDANTRNDGMILPYVEQVADQVDRLSQFLETRRVDDLARDVEGFARRNPAVFLGACFGVGILAARFLKASRPPGYGSTLSDTAYAGNTPYTPTYRTEDHRSATTDGGWVAYGEASYTEPEPTRTNDMINGGGASYSGPMRGTQGTIPGDSNR